jgi:glycosyltransferase involved in cell wall biosynthesis
MQAGFDSARGDVVVTMDGDLQNDPRDIPVLLEKLAEGYDLVAGFRIRRQDRFVTRKIPSWVANRIIRWITGVPIRDNGCSLKAYRRELLSGMRLYSEMHRFIPALAAATAGARITEVGVRHHARARGQSKYGLMRVFRVLADLMAIKMIRSFRLRPLALFATLAAAAAALGTLSMAASLFAIFLFQGTDAVSLVLPGTSLLWYALAVFLLMLGLVGEVAIRQHRIEGMKILPLMRVRRPS